MTTHTLLSRPANSRLRGFTLVELLVVIAIIMILAALGFAGFSAGIEKAKKASAAVAMSSLQSACDDYFEDNSQLPLNKGAKTDTERQSDNELMSILCGLETANDENPTNTTYFTFKKAQGTNNKGWDGLFRTRSQAELYGPWKNRQQRDRFYRLKFDYDYNEEIDEPSQFNTSEPVYGRRVIIYHYGKDGEAGPKKNKDNIYSYKTN